MKHFRIMACCVLVAAWASPAGAVSPTEQQVQALQKTVDTQTAVLRTLLEQTNDKVIAMRAEVDELKKSTQKDLEHDLAANGAKFDSVTSQVEALNASMDETKSRLAKLSDTETGRLSNGTSMSVRSAMSRMTNAPEAIDGTGSVCVAIPAPAPPKASAAVAAAAFAQLPTLLGSPSGPSDADHCATVDAWPENTPDEALASSPPDRRRRKKGLPS